MTARTAHSLVLGKMYPPHVGHELLIRTAASVSDRVSVLVLAHPTESLPLEDRVRWLSEMVCDLSNVDVMSGIDPHPVDYDDPQVWDLHMDVFRVVLAAVTDDPVTAVFTGEAYGTELAQRFGAIHVRLDRGHATSSASATAVRADPVAAWDLLPAPVQGGLARRVVVVGAESTGTTTVARQLTDRLRARGGAHGLTRCVPEHGRDRTVTLLAEATARAALAGASQPSMDDLEWPSAEFVEIARRQNELEDDAARLGGPVLVCDTDAFATGIWHERYRRHASSEVAALGRQHPLYLVTHHEGVPFEQDGIRDGEHVREWMTTRFVDALVATRRRHLVLHGSHTERADAAEAAVDDLLAEGWGFTVPPG